MKKIIYIILSIFLVFVIPCIANEDPWPVATDEDLYGVWESIESWDFNYKIFRLEITRSNTSILTTGGFYGQSYTYYLIDQSLKNGIVKLRFENVDPKRINQRFLYKGKYFTSNGLIDIEGEIKISPSPEPDPLLGVMKCTLTSEPGNPDSREIQLIFYKLREGSLVEDLLIMEDMALESANKFKEKRSNKKLNKDGQTIKPEIGSLNNK